MSLYFATFGNGIFSNSRERISREALTFNIFKKIFQYSDVDEEYKNIHKNFFEKNKKGYGYWISKSKIILQTLKNIEENDILLYCDSGCVLNIEGKPRLLQYFEIVKNHPTGIVCFQLKDLLKTGEIMHPEKRWNKRDTIESILGNNPSDTILNTSQCEAGMIFIKKCDLSMKIIEEWYEFCQNYHLIDDSPSIKTNDLIFQEHRHDQSVFSLLAKKYDVCKILDETYWYPNWNNYPIHARRQKF